MRENRVINLERAARRERGETKDVWYKDIGLTEKALLALHEILFKAQDGVCWICRKPPKKRRLGVDHDHATGKIRGLLCHNCNVGLGNFQDNPALLLRAIEYLNR